MYGLMKYPDLWKCSEKSDDYLENYQNNVKAQNTITVYET